MPKLKCIISNPSLNGGEEFFDVEEDSPDECLRSMSAGASERGWYEDDCRIEVYDERSMEFHEI